MSKLKLLATAIVSATFLQACAVAKTTGKVAALPVKGAYYTGKYAAKGTWGATKMAGKGVYYTGKGVVEVGKTTVHITNAALDTTSKVLTVTTQVVDLSGKVITLSKVIPRAEMEAHIAAAKASGKVLSIVIDAARG